MPEAVIISAARTPIGKAYKGAFSDLEAPTLAAHAVTAALARAGLEPEEVDDCVFGVANQQGTTGFNAGRQIALAAGLPVSVAGMSVDRQCASGLMAISIAAQRIISDGAPVMIAGGCESISLVQNEHANRYRLADPSVLQLKPDYYMSMIDTAEVVARRYGISREDQDAYALASQQRTAFAQESGRFDAEIVPVPVSRLAIGAPGGRAVRSEVVVTRDEGNRPQTTLAALSGLAPVVAGGSITAGNASQLSDGAAACVLMDAEAAAASGIAPMGVFRGLAVAGCEPGEMGIGPVFAIPKLLRRHRLRIDDIGIWEINEAFAVQVLYCRDVLGIPPDRLNVNGGAISIGHPYGMSGARMAMHALIEARRRKERYAVVSMCVGGGMGVAGLFEIV